MEIEYQNTKADYLNFCKAHFAAQLNKKIVLFILLSLLVAAHPAGKSFKGQTFLIVFFVALAALLLIVFFIPYLIAIIQLNKSISKDGAYLERNKLSTTETGLIFQSITKTADLGWQSINSITSSDNYIEIQLADKIALLIPKRFFASQIDVVNFIGIVETGIIKTRGPLNKFSRAITKRDKPPYLLGLLCLIPLIGAFVGLGLLLYGLLKYKDKWLSIIGAAGILWTIVAYSTLFYAGTHASVFKKGFEDISQMQLNSLVKNVEFYKMTHGQYPDSLKQLLDDDKLAPINDVAQGMNTKENPYYNYEKIGDKYLLFSSGQDGIPNTKDDLFPQVTNTDSSKIGLIKHR
jgi:hypothetical protein